MDGFVIELCAVYHATHLDVLQCKVLCVRASIHPEPGCLACDGMKEADNAADQAVNVDVQVVGTYLFSQRLGPGQGLCTSSGCFRQQGSWDLWACKVLHQLILPQCISFRQDNSTSSRPGRQ